MINLIIWLATFLCPNPTHTAENHGNCNLVHIGGTASTNGDTGGETGNPPPPPPPPPHG